MDNKIRKRIEEFRKRYSSELEKIHRIAGPFHEACEKVERSWSGSFAGWHGRMYFRDFQVPSIHERFNGEWGGIRGIPNGWEEKQNDEVRLKIEQLVGNGFSTEQFEQSVKGLRKAAERLKEEVVVDLDSLDTTSLSARGKAFIDRVDKFTFGKRMDEFVNQRLPKALMSRDSEALRQGTCLASWLYYGGIALEGESFVEAVNDFVDLLERVARMTEDTHVRGIPSTIPDTLQSLHPDIYDKCRDLYEKKAYAEAVEKGFKVVRDRLRKLTGYETGSESFGKGKLHVRGAAATNVDQDFNEAVKFLTMAIDRFRNEKSHTSDAKIDDPVRAYEYLRLSSLALNLLGNTEILP